ncbi:MAG: helix-turn-helix domain-containing protein [Actinobacteria bacterium]|nr:helix-turn-helix domain-containing protein [Actinomycetota bacterium]
MQNKEFSDIRHYLGKSQKQLAQLLCISTKAIQSFEQGWRKISASTERQLLFLLSLKKQMDDSTEPCWKIKDCPIEWRQNCSAWEFKAGNFCWFINGTFCQGRSEESWEKKIKICRDCKVLQSRLPKV